MAVALSGAGFKNMLMHCQFLPSFLHPLMEKPSPKKQHRVEAGVLRAIHLGKIQISEIETRGEAALLIQKLFQFEFGSFFFVRKGD